MHKYPKQGHTIQNAFLGATLHLLSLFFYFHIILFCHVCKAMIPIRVQTQWATSRTVGFAQAQQGYILVPGFKVCNAAWSGTIYICKTFAKGRELAVLVVTFYTCRLTYLPSMSVSVHAAVRGEIPVYSTVEYYWSNIYH